MLPYLDSFERIITRTLLAMMAGAVLLAAVELAWFLDKDVLTPRLLQLDLDELLGLFGQFLLVLIGIALLHTMETPTS